MAQLIALILLPLVLAFGLTFVFVSKGRNFVERTRFVLTLHPELGLMKQGLLWLVILAPILYFLGTGFLAWQDYDVLLNAEGFQMFLQISVLPLALLSLAIPLSVLISRLHSTEQSAKQIEIVSHKNNLDTYRSHRQELFSYFEQIGKTEYLSCIEVNFKVHPRLHTNFFLGSPTEGLPSPNVAAFKDIESELSTAQWGIDATLKDVNKPKTLSFYLDACSTIFRLSEKLGIPEIYIELAEKGVLVPAKIEKQPELESLLTVGTTTDELVAAYRIARSFYLNLCDFACLTPSIDTPEYRKYIDTGGRYAKVNDYLSVERLHETEIKSALEKSGKVT
ncbi:MULTISPECIES: hypothetical protein [unclassified Salinivibrio]|uniref:hypothetical protein n=1 Tax=unclassified Salinivibrio TaxID=2636825 RepID=UPI0009867011|nr:MULTISPECIES: hypothetical protein [unclassified Salinivibrio]OOE91270.1 hypothetical protein BZG75_11015 [Salinivibrio sp. AR640]OOE92984.1 hypothetical protein BZG76_06825 [Salinivibrio sp. AR647]